MTDPTEGNPAGNGEQAPSTPAPSPTGQPLEEAVKLLQSRMENLEKAQHGLQKGTDKQIAQAKAEFSSSMEEIQRILELGKQGKEATEINRELALDRLLKGQDAPSAQPRDTGSGGQDFDVEPIIKALGFPENDVALGALKKAYGDDPRTLLTEAAKLRQAQASVPNPAPSNAPPLSGGNGESQVNIEQLTQKYSSEMIAARGNRQSLQEIKERYRKQGVPVDNVVFT